MSSEPSALSDTPEQFTPSEATAARLAKLSPTQRALLDRLVDAVPDTGHQPARTPVEMDLVRIWCEVLKADRIGVTDNFYALGGDSITSLQVSARAAAAGIRVTSGQILGAETIEKLAVLAETSDAPPRIADNPNGEVALTPIQRWFFEQRLPDSHHWDQAIFVDVADSVSPEPLGAALAALVEHHDVLRSGFTRDAAGKWQHTVLAERPPPQLVVADLADFDDPGQADRIRELTAEAQENIGLADGPLLTAVLLRRGPGSTDQLLLAVHHLVVDGVSMRILVDDLASAYRDAEGGQEIRLPERTTSFRAWSQALNRHADLPRVTDQAEYWRSAPDAAAATVPGLEGAQGRNTVLRSATVSSELPVNTVRALRGDTVRARGASTLHVLLAAFTLAWKTWAGRTSVQIDLERHGREHIDDSVDVARTVGWFTAIHPTVLALPDVVEPGAVVDAVRRQLDRVPDNGIGYGLLRYLSGDIGADLAALPQSPVSFNYLGWFERPATDSTFGSPAQAPTQLQSPRAPRRYLIDVVITGIEDRLVIDLTYPADACSESEISRLLDELVKEIGRLAEWHVAPRASRFPLADVADSKLADVVRQVGITR